MRVAIKNSELELFKRIFENGYAIEDGKETKRIIRELKHAGVPIYHGSARNDTKKVIVALEFPLKAVSRRRTLARTVFDVKI